MGLGSCRVIRLTRGRLEEILAGVSRIKIGVAGDGALDLYWRADMTKSELSRETPHYPLPIVEERISLGAGANVAMNASALGARSATLLTVIGEDWRGREFEVLLDRNGIDAGYLIRARDRTTPAYIKPLRRGYADVVYEDPRLDFANLTPLPAGDDHRVLDGLARMATDCDVIAVVDQFTYGVITDGVRTMLGALCRSGLPVVVDSRARIGDFAGVIIKPNEFEAAWAVGQNPGAPPTPEACLANACELRARTGKPVLVTLGERGALWTDEDGAVWVPPCAAEPPLDIVGAGDTFLAAFCCAYAAGASGPEAVALANLAAGVVVGKIGTTGTASPEEIMRLFEKGDGRH